MRKSIIHILFLSLAFSQSNCFAENNPALSKMEICGNSLKDSAGEQLNTESLILAKIQQLKEQLESYGTNTEGQIQRRRAVERKIESAKDKCVGLSEKITNEFVSFEKSLHPSIHKPSNPKIRGTDQPPALK